MVQYGLQNWDKHKQQADEKESQELESCTFSPSLIAKKKPREQKFHEDRGVHMYQKAFA